ncbi:hypothetical protein IFM89_009356 [Coptis chinensis]|uniref:Uncharacterized protein n=1 Tax=Coptis chinensis TaxID=261450 RepID=A0A835HK54_9MAGN|nr:hypothetical protein IFM89_009356 [Coptis chinensis]
MAIINPGNPTDEVYQQNIYQDAQPFLSARKVLLDMGLPVSKEVQLVSFHTVSKGYWGECGQRGGYIKMANIPLQTVDEIYKIASISLSPNVPGQIFMGLMVSPPKPRDISYQKYVQESNSVLESLRRRAHIMTNGFNSCRNVVCNFTKGRQIRLPPKAIEVAKKAGKVPDVFYCLKLLEATGISTVPGSGFGQKEGVFHLRTTILPAEEDMPAIMESFKKFNDEFMEQYEEHRGYSRIVGCLYHMIPARQKRNIAVVLQSSRSARRHCMQMSFGIPYRWETCSDIIGDHRKDSPRSMLPIYRELISHGIEFGCLATSPCGAVGTTDSMNLGAYGVELALKNMEYKAMDDSTIKKAPTLKYVKPKVHI